MKNVVIIIPCHNHALWVGQAIRSVIDQDYENKHIVVVNNGSRDASLDVILSTIEEFERDNPEENFWFGATDDTLITVFNFKEGLGPSRARNYGIKYALERLGADIIGFLDSDDEYLEGKIDRSVALIEKDGIGVVYSDYETVNVHTNVFFREYKHPFDYEVLLRECIVNNDSLVDAQCLKECGLYDESMRVAEDYELWLRIAQRFMFAHLPEALVLIRQGDYNSTNTVSKEVWNANWQKIAQRYRKSGT